MDDKKPWKYCVVGNIVRSHIDDEGIVRNGTPEYPGGARVYLCGKYWDHARKEITVVGLTRGKRHQVHEVPTKLIENVRCSRTYKPGILKIMNNWEFYDCWWGDTQEDKKAVQSFVEAWNTVLNGSSQQKESPKNPLDDNMFVELFETPAKYSPVKKLPNLIKCVDQMSSDLVSEVDEFLDEGIPHTAEGITDLISDSFSVVHRNIYELDLSELWVFLDSCTGEYYDQYCEAVKAIQSVVDRMHVVCTLRDDIIDMIRSNDGRDDQAARYTILHHLSIQNHNLSYAQTHMNAVTAEHFKKAEEVKGQLTLFDSSVLE